MGALLAVAAIGCREPPPAPLPHGSSPVPVRGGEMHLASFGDIKSLDPAVAGDTLTGEVIELMYAGLVDFDEQGHVVPDLAERFERSDDGLVYRFFLREGIRFHDGSPVTAQDVKRSIERTLHPDTPPTFSAFYDRIVGFDDYQGRRADHLAGVVVEGERVVAIHLREPDASFLAAFAMQNLRPVCPSAGDRYDDTWQPCGAGPFKLEAWDRGRSLRLVRFDGWWQPGKPYFDALTYTYGMNMSTERFKFERGDLDIDRELLLADIFRYQGDPRWKPLGAYDAAPSIGGEELNVEIAPFDNVEVRRAVACAIDREQIRMVKPPALTPLYRVLPPTLSGDDPSFPGQKYDYAAALEHMRRAGYPYDPATGTGGWPKPIVYVTYKQGLVEYTAQVIQQQLARIGLRLEIRMVSYPTYLAMSKRRGTVAITNSGWSQDFPDASDFFEPIFATAAINDEDSNNGSFYSNPKLDDILVRARKELDPAVRKRLYDDADAIVCGDAPWAMEYLYRYYGVHQPYVRDLAQHNVWSNYVRDAWLDKPPARTSSARASVRLAPRGLFGSILAVLE
ncbi:MAG TPA: ABC transporter substrate-binding protein [Polyangiaceae bacterium]|nr:ABC transporter substrate-binding protein [Polyangiaceae bacterium]